MNVGMPVLALLGAVEFGMVAFVIVLLLGAKKIPELFSGVRTGCREFKNATKELAAELNDRESDLVGEALTHDNRTAEFLLADDEPDEVKSKLIVWLAQGFGVGRIPFAPGTWGSLVGVGWALLLLGPGSLVFYLVGIFLSTLGAVWICDRAVRLSGRHDSGSVVLDQIVAVPIALGGSVMAGWVQDERMPGLAALANGWPALVAAFALFRLFDEWKPWPVRTLRQLPGGWGMVADDSAAGIVSAAVLWVGCQMFG